MTFADADEMAAHILFVQLGKHVHKAPFAGVDGNFRRIRFGERFGRLQNLFDVVARFGRRIAIRFTIETRNVGHLLRPAGRLFQHLDVPLLLDLGETSRQRLPRLVHTLRDKIVLRSQMRRHFGNDFAANAVAFGHRLDDVGVEDDEEIDAIPLIGGRHFGPVVCQYRSIDPRR